MERERSRIPIVRIVQNLRIVHAVLSGNPELTGKLADKFGIPEEDRRGYIDEATQTQYQKQFSSIR